MATAATPFAAFRDFIGGYDIVVERRRKKDGTDVGPVTISVFAPHGGDLVAQAVLDDAGVAKVIDVLTEPVEG